MYKLYESIKFEFYPIIICLVSVIKDLFYVIILVFGTSFRIIGLR